MRFVSNVENKTSSSSSSASSLSSRVNRFDFACFLILLCLSVCLSVCLPACVQMRCSCRRLIEEEKCFSQSNNQSEDELNFCTHINIVLSRSHQTFFQLFIFSPSSFFQSLDVSQRLTVSSCLRARALARPRTEHQIGEKGRCTHSSFSQNGKKKD